MTSNAIRESFLEFFRTKGHSIVPSAPMVVKGDPTLMFTNAGMNQFKDVILGNVLASHKRAADTQKCLRVSGKHNDLEEVGHDTYHHTMFEMLGNWSFGDYFKREAIEWAWEYLTGVLHLPAERIYVTVFEGDEADGVPFDTEAWELWRNFVPEEHILRGNKKDNFWEMGDTGPCGPCSEIHFDNRPDEERAAVSGASLVNRDNPLVIEIWNLVFMQFLRKADGSLTPLEMRCIDTGMGFERLCMIVQGVRSNYDTDIFQPTIQRLADMCKKHYGHNSQVCGQGGGQATLAEKIGGGAYSDVCDRADIEVAEASPSSSPQTDVAMRVIADHLRAIAFSIADGQLPSNVKAGYVIRRILRRAVRYGYTYLGFTEPFMWRLIDGLAAQMGGQFPELRAQKELIEKVIQEEEASFLRTLATGISLLDGVMARAKADGRNTISGTDAFQLYDTFGFPIDLTELIARENGLGVDLAGFEKELAAQKERSRGAAVVESGDWIELMPLKESEFTGYDTLTDTVRIARYRQVTTKGKTTFQLVFDRTPFYGNSGGQVGDSGYIIESNDYAADHFSSKVRRCKACEEAGGGVYSSVNDDSGDEHNAADTGFSRKIQIIDTLKENGQTVHVTTQLPQDPSATFTAVVDADARAATAANHSATHLLHEALREVLGTHVEQKGSLVSPRGLRFDFSHFQKVTPEELRAVERRVNAAIRADLPLDEDRDSTLDEAKAKGAMMLFGEKYGEKVRVVCFGDSVELCGGTHAPATGAIGLFKIVSEGAISAGVRRIEAVTGIEAENLIYAVEDTIAAIRETVCNPRVQEAVQKMCAENAALVREVADMHREKIEAMADRIAADLAGHEQDGMIVVSRRFEMKPELVRGLMQLLRQRSPRIVMVAGIEFDGRPTLAISLGDEIVARGVNAGKVIREAAREIDGNGGGQPFFAMAGGKDRAGLERAMEKAVELIENETK